MDHNSRTVSPLRGEWIEMASSIWNLDETTVSPLRGEWIEIRFIIAQNSQKSSRLSEASGLKSRGDRNRPGRVLSRLSEASGLKLHAANTFANAALVSPLRGEWIEICLACCSVRGSPSRLSEASGLKSSISVTRTVAMCLASQRRVD